MSEDEYKLINHSHINNDTEGFDIYTGYLYRIPAEDYPDNVESYIKDEPVKLEEFLRAMEEGGHRPNPTLERYETLDTETGDLLVLYRVSVKMKVAFNVTIKK